METSAQWTGIFFDGGLCLAGAPNPAAINLVKNLLAEGETVKVIAPRIALQGEDDGKGGTRDPEGHIRQWCQRRFGAELPITTQIDRDCAALYWVKAKRVPMPQGTKKKAAKKKSTQQG